MKEANASVHLLVVTCGGGGSLLLYFCGECFDDMRDPRRLEHHLRSIAFGFVREFSAQLVDVDILKSEIKHQRSALRNGR